MGTRGVYGFIKDGKHKVSYNHFDSYPSELGVSIFEFADRHSIDEMKEMFDNIQLVDEHDIPTKDQIQKCKELGLVNFDVSNQTSNDWYCLLRNAQGDLEAAADVGYMINGRGFINDSLFCEWGYIINLDTEEIEIYRGFQKEPPKGRYNNISSNEEGYYAIGLIGCVSLSDIKLFLSAISEIDIDDLLSKDDIKLKGILDRTFDYGKMINETAAKLKEFNETAAKLKELGLEPEDIE